MVESSCSPYAWRDPYQVPQHARHLFLRKLIMQTITNKIDKIAKMQPWKHEIYDFISTSSLLPEKNILNSPFTKKELQTKLNNLYLCGHHLETEYQFENGDKTRADHVLKTGNFCKTHLICPVCASRLQSQTMGKYKTAIFKAAEDYKNAYMLTVTIKDGENLKERIEHLKKSMQRLRKRKKSEFSKITASIIKIEVHKGDRSNLWHPHFHCLVFSNERIDYRVYDEKKKNDIKKRCSKEDRTPTKRDLLPAALNLIGDMPMSKLSLDWLKATKNDSHNISCEPLRRDKYKKLSEQENIFRQSIEVLKYTNKFNAARLTKTHSPDDYIEVLCALSGKRTRSTTGAFRGIGTKEAYVDSSIKTPDGGYSLGWSVTEGHYSIVDVELKNSAIIAAKKQLLIWTNKITGRFRALRARRIRATRANDPFCNVDAIIDTLRARYIDIIREFKLAQPNLHPIQIDSLLLS